MFQTRTFRARVMSLYMYATLASRVHTEVFLLVPCRLGDALCHIFGKQTRGGEEGERAINSLLTFKKRHDMVLMERYAE